MTSDLPDPHVMPAREKILRKVIDLVPLHGADRITHRLVADEAGVSPGTLTYHFTSIDALVADAFRLYMTDYRAGLDAALTARPLASREDVARFLVALATTAPDTSELARFEYAMVSYAQRDEGLLAEVSDWSRLLENQITDALARLGMPAPQTTANVLLTVCRGTEFDVMTRRITVDETRLEQRFLALMAAGL